MLILTAIITPIKVCFIEDEDNEDSWAIIENIFDLYFAGDMLINFLSAYYDEYNRLITYLPNIALQYI